MAQLRWEIILAFRTWLNANIIQLIKAKTASFIEVLSVSTLGLKAKIFVNVKGVDFALGNTTTAYFSR